MKRIAALLAVLTLTACGGKTNDDKAATVCRMLRDHGQVKKYFHDIEGYNGRLDALQAGLLHVKLGHLGKWNSQRQGNGGRRQHLVAIRNEQKQIGTHLTQAICQAQGGNADRLRHANIGI